MAGESIKSIFDREEFKPLGAKFQARQQRFSNYWAYYKADVYNGSQNGKTALQSAPGKYTAERISASVRPLFTPLARAVNIDVALIPGDWALADETYQAAVDTVFFDSRWDVEGELYVKYLVAMGEAALYVVDDRANGRVMLQALRPDSYLVVPTSRYNPTPSMAILIAAGTDDVGAATEEATVLTADLIQTFVNGQLQPIGDRPAEYANALGFVPVVECKNDPGDGMGEPTFDDAIASLDQVNLQATHLANIIQKHAEPQWAAFGADAGDLEKSGDAVWFFPEGSDVKAILAAVDFPGVLQFVQEIKGEVKESLPELALAQLVGVERVAAATIELQMAEAVFKIRHLRKPVDLCLADALRLAGRAAANMGISDLAVLDNRMLAFDKKRPVITLDALTRLQLDQAGMSRELQALALERERALMNGQEGTDE